MKPNNFLTESQISDIINTFRFSKNNTAKQIYEKTGINKRTVDTVIDNWLSGKIK